jgi:hypothetical protein
MRPGADDAMQKLVKIISILIMDLEADAAGKLPYGLTSFSIFKIGVDVRIIKIARRVHALLFQPEIGVECTGGAAYMEEDIHHQREGTIPVFVTGLR